MGRSTNQKISKETQTLYDKMDQLDLNQGRGSLVGCRLWGHTESDTTEVTYIFIIVISSSWIDPLIIM